MKITDFVENLVCEKKIFQKIKNYAIWKHDYAFILKFDLKFNNCKMHKML